MIINIFTSEKSTNVEPNNPDEWANINPCPLALTASLTSVIYF